MTRFPVALAVFAALFLWGCDKAPVGISVDNQSNLIVTVDVDNGRYSLEVQPHSAQRLVLDVNYKPREIVLIESSSPPRRTAWRFESKTDDFDGLEILVERNA